MLQLQITDLLSDDISNGDNGKNFLVTIYGRTYDNQTVVCNVIGFKPFFYLKVPATWSATTVKRFLRDVDHNIESLIKPQRGYDPKDDLLPIQKDNFQDYTELYGFQCDQMGTRLKHRFLKLSLCLQSYETIFQCNSTNL